MKCSNVLVLLMFLTCMPCRSMWKTDQVSTGDPQVQMLETIKQDLEKRRIINVGNIENQVLEIPLCDGMSENRKFNELDKQKQQQFKKASMR